MTPIAKRPEPVAWLEHRSDELITFFRSVLAEIERGDINTAKQSLENAIAKVRMDAKSKGTF